MTTPMTDRQRDIFNDDIDSTMKAISAAMEKLAEANRIIESSLPDKDHDPSVLYRTEYNRGLTMIHEAMIKLQNIPRRST